MDTMIFSFDRSYGSFTWHVRRDRQLKVQVILFDNPEGGGYAIWDEKGRIIETGKNMKRRDGKAVLKDGKIEFSLSFDGFKGIGEPGGGVGGLLIQVFKHSYLGKHWLGNVEPVIVERE